MTVVIEGRQSWELETLSELKIEEARADEHAAEESDIRWRNAERAYRLTVQGSYDQKDIAEELGKSETHMSFVVNAWRVYLGKPEWQKERPSWNEAYHSPEVRGNAHGRGDNPEGDEWYTPKWLFDDLGLVFALDVAAPPGGVPWIPAEAYFSEADDGLTREWDGTVWCNPPYSSITPWARKWIDHGDGVLLVPFVKSAWLAEVANAAGNLWIPPKGIDFESPNGGTKALSYMVFLAGIGVVGLEAVERVHAAAGGALR